MATGDYYVDENGDYLVDGDGDYVIVAVGEDCCCLGKICETNLSDYTTATVTFTCDGCLSGTYEVDLSGGSDTDINGCLVISSTCSFPFDVTGVSVRAVCDPAENVIVISCGTRDSGCPGSPSTFLATPLAIPGNVLMPGPHTLTNSLSVGPCADDTTDITFS